MLDISNYVFFFFTLVTILISCLVYILTRHSHNPKCANLPPGPKGWPVVGNLLQFARSGKQFFEYVDEMRNIYGPIFTLKMGIRTMIIISDANLAHQALIEQSPIRNPTRRNSDPENLQF